MIEFSKVDLARCETVIKALKRGKYELEGDEVLAFSQSFAWLSSLFDRMQADIMKPKSEPVEPTKEPEPKAEKKPKK